MFSTETDLREYKWLLARACKQIDVEDTQKKHLAKLDGKFEKLGVGLPAARPVRKLSHGGVTLLLKVFGRHNGFFFVNTTL